MSKKQKPSNYRKQKRKPKLPVINIYDLYFMHLNNHPLTKTNLPFILELPEFDDRFITIPNESEEQEIQRFFALCKETIDKNLCMCCGEPLTTIEASNTKH